MFSTVLVANRGEIAVRIIATLRRLGIRAAAVYSDADVGARHVAEADVAIRIGAAAAAQSYLNADAVVAAALSVGAQAVHPGYGFLAENAGFARACASAGLVFVGPPPESIEAMGDKIRAKQTVEAAGVPVVPGRHERGMDDADIAEAAVQIGFPVLLKPSAGGGGKGMRRVDSLAGIPEAVTAARREARAAFGDDTLLVERFVQSPRHIEIQVLADRFGSTVHLGERECSLQRRHQKIVEEAPSPLLTPAQRAAMGRAGVEVAAACGYVGAGTVEFIVDGERPESFFFMEMNTRLQVEHPVTELVTGVDLVEQQLRCAAGEPLTLSQADVVWAGHAVEARVYAEDPARGFLPTGGRVLALREPTGEGVRVDSGIASGSVVTSDYDPMLAKVVAWGPDRASALRRLDGALAASSVLGVTTNIAFLRTLLADPDVLAGRLDTQLVERRLDCLVDAPVPDEAVVAAALGRLAEREPAGRLVDPFDVPSGWRIGGEPAWTHERLQSGGGPVVDVRLRGRAGDAQVRVGEAAPVPASARVVGHDLTVTVDGRTAGWAYARDGLTLWVGRDGSAWALREVPPRARAVDDDDRRGPLVSPMPGTVTAVHVAVGEAVRAGQPVVTVEAMKMEHVLRAVADGVVSAVLVVAGQTVAMEAPLAVVDVGALDPAGDPALDRAPGEGG